jgi:hypothetical protein
MNLSQTAQAAARLAVVNEKAQAALNKGLTNWFSTQFVKSIKMPALQGIHQSGAYTAFAEFLSDASDAERIAILKKIDLYRPEMLMRSKAEVMAHIEALAAGHLAPAPKPPTGKHAASSRGKGSQKKVVGIISTSKY